MILRGSARRTCHLENVKSYMSYLQQYTKIIKKLTLKTYFSLIVSNLKCTRSQITSNFYVSNWKSSMTSCWLCSKVVNNISGFFSVYNHMCIVCPLFEALLRYFFNSIQHRKQTRCPRIRIIRIKTLFLGNYVCINSGSSLTNFT